MKSRQIDALKVLWAAYKLCLDKEGTHKHKTDEEAEYFDKSLRYFPQTVHEKTESLSIWLSTT